MTFKKTYAEALTSFKPLKRSKLNRKSGLKSRSNGRKSEKVHRVEGPNLSNPERTGRKWGTFKRRSGIRIDPADKYFSLFVRFRANWRCEKCGTQYEVGSQGLHASHFWSRRFESTRFDPENVSAHCFSCHTFLGGNPELHRQWKLKQLGQSAYDLLMVRAQTTQKKDRKLTLIICKELYRKEKSRYELEFA